MGVAVTLYERLGVAHDADGVTLRAAYRRLARQLHPDVAGPAPPGDLDMAQVNEAWRILSDPGRRRAYDATLRWPDGDRTWRPTAPAADAAGRRPSSSGPAGSSPSGRPGPAGRATAGGAGGFAGAGAGAPGSATTDRRDGDRPADRSTDRAWSGAIGARREAWLGGLRLQIRRLGTQAARSATQTLVIRHRGVPRQPYEALIAPIVDHLLDDTAERVRRARLAGAAPLDLAIGAALVGLRAYADELVGFGRLARPGVDDERMRAAEMIDRMWDTMAHEIPRELAVALGGNPRTARHLRP